MTGAWKLLDLEICGLPQKVATGFSKVLNEGKLGATFVPVLYCATQLVKGTNHMIIAKREISDLYSTETIVAVNLNEALPVDGGDFTLVTITEIL